MVFQPIKSLAANPDAPGPDTVGGMGDGANVDGQKSNGGRTRVCVRTIQPKAGRACVRPFDKLTSNERHEGEHEQSIHHRVGELVVLGAGQ